MLPSNILVALVAPLMGLTQAAALHPNNFVTVHLYGKYDKHYVEKVWPDGDEHWFSKCSKAVLFLTYHILLLPALSVNASHAYGLSQQTRARMSGRRKWRSSSSSTTRRRRTVRSAVSPSSHTTPGTHSRSRSSSSCLTSTASRPTACSWRSLSPLRSFGVIFPKGGVLHGQACGALELWTVQYL